MRNSIHSDIIIFLESNTVPVSGLNDLPQERHRKRAVPSFRWPFLTISADPQNGQQLTSRELMNSVSGFEILGCFAASHSDRVSRMRSSLLEYATSFPYAKGLPHLGSFSFLILAVRNLCESAKPGPPSQAPVRLTEIYFHPTTVWV